MATDPTSRPSDRPVARATRDMPSLPPGISSHLLELIDIQLDRNEIAAALRLATTLLPESLAGEAPVAERRAAIGLRRNDLDAAAQALAAATRPTPRLHLFEAIVVLRLGRLHQAKAASAIACGGERPTAEAVILDATLDCLGLLDETPCLSRDPAGEIRERLAARGLAGDRERILVACRELVSLLGGRRQATPRCGLACLTAGAIEEFRAGLVHGPSRVAA
jgi:hypothetical protein